MAVYISLLGAILIAILAIILFFYFGPLGLLLFIIVAILIWLAFREGPATASV
jgi:hypothetical protein